VQALTRCLHPCRLEPHHARAISAQQNTLPNPMTRAQ
jgi:hypothetical protein